MKTDLEATTSECGPDVSNLLKEAGAYIRSDDETGLLRFLRRAWSVGALTDLLQGEDSVAGWVAAYCLGVLGGPIAVMPLVRALHHDDPAVASAAEDALWRIWFDEVGTSARRSLQKAATHISQESYSAATAVLDEVIARYPAFAEAYNQRAIARYLHDDYIGSIADYKRSVDLNRSHFGAYAGMGHSHTHLGHYAEAIACYRTALTIHPRIEGVRQSIRRIQDLSTHRVPVA